LAGIAHNQEKTMPYVTVGEENSAPIELYYEDHGSGHPVVLIHGYPRDGHSWEKQVPVLLDAGKRVITYDRRGFGHSSQPSTGYDYDTFAADLQALIDKLDLRDIVLVGFSMGTGEVTRYLGTYGSDRVAKAALFGPIPPFLLQTDDNPKEYPRACSTGSRRRSPTTAMGGTSSSSTRFYNVDKFHGTRISEQAWNASFQVAASSSAYATLACVSTWLTDFRADLPKIDVPLLVVQGTEDRILPIDATGRRIPGLVKDFELIEIEGGPHNVGWTHADEVNQALIQFVC
jgi:non-heme chloroperoxidase